MNEAQGGVNVWTTRGPSDSGIVNAVAIDPKNPTTLYAAATNGVFKSTDGGESWNALSISRGFMAVNYYTVLAVAPVGGNLYLGTGSGAFLMSMNGGQTWTSSDKGRELPDGDDGYYEDSIVALALNWVDPSTLYLGAVYEVYKSVDGGNSWTTASFGLPLYTFPLCALAIDPVTPTTLYAGTEGGGGVQGGGVFKSIDGGGTWSATPLSGTSILALAVDPVTSRTVYAGGTGGVFKSTDGGNTWNAANVGLPLPVDYVEALAIDPSASTTLYTGPLGVYGGGWGVYKSTDGGNTWSALNTGLPAKTAVTSLVVDPNRSTRLYAGVATGVEAGVGIDGETGGVFSIDQAPVCTGDCANEGQVTVGDVLTLVNVALGTVGIAACPAGDVNHDNRITIDEIVQAVDNALGDCAPTPTPNFWFGLSCDFQRRACGHTATFSP